MAKNAAASRAAFESLVYLGKFAEDAAAVCIYDLPAWAVGETRTVASDLADRIRADFPDYFGSPSVQADAPSSTPTEQPESPAKES